MHTNLDCGCAQCYRGSPLRTGKTSAGYRSRSPYYDKAYYDSYNNYLNIRPVGGNRQISPVREPH
jgi:hypothetical protein